MLHNQIPFNYFQIKSCFFLNFLRLFLIEDNTPSQILKLKIWEIFMITFKGTA